MSAVLPGLPGSVNPQGALAYARRNDFGMFAVKALREIVPDLDDNWHHHALYKIGDDIAQGDARRVMVNIAPRSLKSVIFSTVLPAFLLGQDPTCKMICVSYSQSLADLLAAGTRKIMRTGWYRELFPNTRVEKSSLENLTTTEGGIRKATSVHGSVTGFGADVIIIDDPIKADDVYSDARRTATNDWIRSTLLTRLNKRSTGRILVVAQRLHEDDVCGMLLGSGGWNVVSMPAIATEPQRFDLGHGRWHERAVGDLLHPTRLPLEELEQIRAEIGSRNMDAQYQQEPTPADGAMFKRGWLKAYDGPYVKQPGDRIIQSWDMANKTGDGNDWSVCITAVERRSQVIILDVFRDRLAFPDLKKKVVALALEHKPYKLLIEDAAAGTQMIQVLRAEQPAGVRLPIAIKPEKDKISRADRAAARVEAGALLLPAKAPWLDAFVSELMAFPGRHDDQVDALVQLLIYTEQNRLPRGLASPAVEKTTPDSIMNDYLRNR